MFKYKTIHKSEHCALAQIHMRSFDGFFLTSLGEGFLRAYYKACLNSNLVLAVCAKDDKDQIVGFSIGTEMSNRFHFNLLFKNIFGFLKEIIILLFTRPAAIIRLIKNLNKKSNVNDDGNYAELLSIAVLPEMSNYGIGKKLIKEFERLAIKRGCKKITLTTDYTDNTSVLRFYKKMDYRVFYTFISYPNRKMYKMIKVLNAA